MSFYEERKLGYDMHVQICNCANCHGHAWLCCRVVDELFKLQPKACEVGRGPMIKSLNLDWHGTRQ